MVVVEVQKDTDVGPTHAARRKTRMPHGPMAPCKSRTKRRRMRGPAPSVVVEGGGQTTREDIRARRLPPRSWRQQTARGEWRHHGATQTAKTLTKTGAQKD